MGEEPNDITKINNPTTREVKWYGGPIQSNQTWPLDSKNGFTFTPHVLWDLLKVLKCNYQRIKQKV